MLTRNFLFVLLLSNLNTFSQNLPNVVSGKIHRIENFHSKFVAERNVDVWLPENYDPSLKYSVLYMQDGQNLFDSTQTWTRKEWGVDETASRLIKENKIERCIVVGIWNSGKYRHSEYFPQKFLNTVSDDFKKEFISTYLENNPQSDNYLKFIVQELKPYVDSNFSTYPDKDHTFIMGSSMGGLISFYAIAEYPEVFKGAACMSIAWVSMLKKNFELPLAGFNYLQKNTPSATGHIIYMDHGTTEMDTMYGVFQDFVDVIMREKGFGHGSFKSEVFPGTGHNETDWAQRLNIPFEFLLGKTQGQKVISGKIDNYEDFGSRYINSRNIEVWLPEGYAPSKKYNVLYMHDGQMLFDSTTSWNHATWNVDDVITNLLREKKIMDVIIVGIWNGVNSRHADYFPQKPFESLPPEKKDAIYRAARTNGISVFNDYKIHSDDYLKFLVKELKPFIDKKYSTYRDAKHTFIAGSSMGGLISIYAICEYPKIFGGAACLSTHWPGIFTMDGNPFPDAMIEYLQKNLPDPKKHKIYFDYGDQTLDAMYPPLQKKADEVMKARGYTKESWETLSFPGKDHSEKAWSERLSIPVEFLLSNH